jgi:hypothetical protein
MGGEAMIPYLARLLDITIINGTIPRDWKKTIVVPMYKGGDRSVVKNYRPVSLTSVICKKRNISKQGTYNKCGNTVIGSTGDNMASDRDTRARVK